MTEMPVWVAWEKARRSASERAAREREQRNRLVTLVRIGFLASVEGERATADLVREPEHRALLMAILQAEDTEHAVAAIDRMVRDEPA